GGRGAPVRRGRGRALGGGGGRPVFGPGEGPRREIHNEQARRKASGKHGGKGQRLELGEGIAWIEPPADDLLALDEAITRLQAEEPRLAEIVLLRYYAGLTVEEATAHRGAQVGTIHAAGA